MRHSGFLYRHYRLGRAFECLTAIAAIIFFTASALAQKATQGQPQMSPEDFKKFSGAFKQLGDIWQKMPVQSPAPRTESHILPLLPQSTLVYAAFPNYGEVSHQFVAAFQQEIKENAELRSWWQQGEMATEGPKIEDALEKFYQVSQYLGDEIVVSAASEGKDDPKFLIVAEVRKPGLKEYLRVMLKDLAGKSKPAARVFDPAELAAAKNVLPEEPIILVRPDLVILGENLATLRSFNSQLDQKNKDFASTEFGRRLVQGYEGGVTIMAAADLRRILKIPSSKTKNEDTLQRTGFADMKYAVWTHTSIGKQGSSQIELSFTGPRRAIASWLAAPGPMGSLDFVSPKAVVALSLLLKNPAAIFDDIKDLTTASNPNGMASIRQMEEGLNVSLRDDVLGRLSGEIALEMDSFTPPNPAWKVIAKTTDPVGLLATIRKILSATNNVPKEFDEDGVTYHMIAVPSAGKRQEIAYAVVDGYLIVASGREILAESVHLHRSGQSLARSSKFEEALPTGNLAEMSALVYEDPIAMAGITLRQASPELAEMLANSKTDSPPVLMAGYGEETALREISRSGGTDVGAALVVAAIAIPNLLRARVAANESSAVASVRTLSTAEITYQATYPQKGFAHDMASLGPDPKGPNLISAQHASLVDASLGDATCTFGAWCTKSGYRFNISTTCKHLPCSEYVVVATPVSNGSGSKNFCSTSDAVVRSRIAPPLESAISAAECLTWAPLKQ